MTRLKEMKSFLAESGILSENAHGAALSHDAQLAVAVIVVRAAYCDNRFASEEREEILNDLGYEFGMERRDVENLIEEARDLQKLESWMSSYIEDIRENFDIDQRIEVLSVVWRVMEADGMVDEADEEFVESLELRLGLSAEEGEEAQRRAQLSLPEVN